MPSQAFVQVVADTSDVEAQLDREMARIVREVERSLDPITIDVEVDDHGQLRELQASLFQFQRNADDINIRVNIDDRALTDLRLTLARIQQSAGEVEVPAQLVINELQVITALARMQQFLNARHLTVHADIDIDRDAIARLLASAGSSAGSAGGSVAGAGFASSFLSAPAIAGIGALLGPILVASIGTIAALGIGGIVAGIAFQGFGDAVAAIISGDQDKIAEAMKGLAPSAQDVAAEFGVVLLPVLRDIQDSIQQAFFEPLIGSGTDLANALEKLEPSLTLVAEAMGKLVAKLIEMLTSDENLETFNQILKDSAVIIEEVAPYIGEVLVLALQLLAFFIHHASDAFTIFKSTITAPVEGLLVLKDGIQGFIETIVRFALSIYNNLTDAKGSFNNFKTTVGQHLEGARTFVSNFPANVSAGLASLRGTMLTRANEALNSFKTAINQRISEALDYIRSIPSRARSALGSLGSTLRGSGQSLMQGFIDGILSKIGGLISAIKQAVGTARDYFPFSPAKEGPFSGRGYTTYSGAALMEGFAAGIKSQTSQLQDAVGSTLASAAGVTGGPTVGDTGSSAASGLVPQSFTSNPNVTVIIGGQAIEGAVETVVERSNAQRDRQLAQGVRR